MTEFDRRRFLEAGLAAGAGLVLSGKAIAQPHEGVHPAGARGSAHTSITKPDRLKVGDTVCLIDASTAMNTHIELQLAIESLEALGLKVKVAPHATGRYGYFSAPDKDRAAGVNAAFLDKSVKAVIALKGGWGPLARCLI